MTNVVLLIIDEISMISNVILLYIHLRLGEIFETPVYDWWSKFINNELTLNMRQNGDTIYRNILRKFRIGLISEKDIAILKERQIN